VLGELKDALSVSLETLYENLGKWHNHARYCSGSSTQTFDGLLALCCTKNVFSQENISLETSMAYAEELVACKQHVISLCQQRDFLHGQMACADEPAHSSVEVKNSLVLKGNRYKKLEATVMLSAPPDSKLKSLVMLKRKCLLKEKPRVYIKFACRGKGWVAEELMIQWPDIWDRLL
jgi:hypothetical protein